MTQQHPYGHTLRYKVVLPNRVLLGSLAYL